MLVRILALNDDDDEVFRKKIGELQFERENERKLTDELDFSDEVEVFSLDECVEEEHERRRCCLHGGGCLGGIGGLTFDELEERTDFVDNFKQAFTLLDNFFNLELLILLNVVLTSLGFVFELT